MRFLLVSRAVGLCCDLPSNDMGRQRKQVVRQEAAESRGLADAHGRLSRVGDVSRTFSFPDSPCKPQHAKSLFRTDVRTAAVSVRRRSPKIRSPFWKSLQKGSFYIGVDLSWKRYRELRVGVLAGVIGPARENDSCTACSSGPGMGLFQLNWGS